MNDRKTEARSLTQHKAGSLKELFTLSLPLMLGGASGGLMMFLDRVILSYYSIPVMNAAVSASMMAILFQYPLISIAAISEVFVGRFNGSKDYSRIGSAVWQMIWFSLASAIFFIPMALFSAKWVLPNAQYELGKVYYQLMMGASPLFGIVAALTGYYVGQGKTKKVMYLNFLANLANISLDYIFIFGIDGFVPEMGAAGAALGTICGQTLLLIGLATFLWNDKAIREHGARNYAVDGRLLKNSLKIGGPNAIAHLIEMAAHSIVLHLLSAESTLHMTAFSIGHSLLLLVAFLNDGMQKGGMSIVSNFIGQERLEMIPKTLKSMIKLNTLTVLLFAIPVLLFPKTIAAAFLGLDVSSEVEILRYAPAIYVGLCLFLLVDSFAWSFATIFTAAGDTIFMMVVGTINVYVFDVLAIYLSIHIYHMSPAWVWYTANFFAFMNLTVFSLRYYSGTWKKYISKTQTL